MTERIAHIFTASAVTSLSLHGRVPLRPASLDLVLIDEASQCDIASAIPLLLRAKRVVIIGDPQQLSHVTQIPARLDASLLKEFDLEAFRTWGFSQNSLFRMVAANCRSEDVVTLVEHHRSAHDIISFSNEFFYQNRLRVATRSRKTESNEPAVEWRDVRGGVTKIYGKGAVNDVEAKAVTDFIEDLVVKRAYKGTVGVVTPFRGQANRINDYVSKVSGLDRESVELIVDTVHKFQGDERDMMIFSPVVSGGISPNALGFLASQGNLFNVAVTRARSRLIVIGDRAACASSGVSYLSGFVEHAEKVQKRKQIELGNQVLKPEGLELSGLAYPKVANPQHVSDWEREFYKALRRNNIIAVPQYPVDEYRLDFAVFDGDRKLNIEIDGERYHRGWNGELIERDLIRNRRLVEQGWSVLRFWVYQVREKEQECVAEVLKWLNQK